MRVAYQSPPRPVPNKWMLQGTVSKNEGTASAADTVTSSRIDVLKFISKRSESLEALEKLKPAVNKCGQSVSTVVFKKPDTPKVVEVITDLLPYDMPCIFEIDPTNTNNKDKVDSTALATIFKNSKPNEMLAIVPIDNGYVLVQRVKTEGQETYSLYRNVPGFSCNERNVPKASSLKNSFQYYNIPKKTVLTELRAKALNVVSDHAFIAGVQNLLNDDYAQAVVTYKPKAKDAVMSWARTLIWATENSLEDTNANKSRVNKARDALEPLLPGKTGRTFEQIQFMFRELQNLLALKAPAITSAMDAGTTTSKLTQLAMSALHAHRMEKNLGNAFVLEVKAIEQHETKIKTCEEGIALCRNESVRTLSQFMFQKVYHTSEVYNDTTKLMPVDVVACLAFNPETKLYEPLKPLLELLEKKIMEIGKSFDTAKELRKLDAFKRLPRNEAWMDKDTLITLAQQVIDEADQKGRVVSMTKELATLRSSAQVKESGPLSRFRKYLEDTTKLEKFTQTATIIRTNIEKIKSYQGTQIRVIEGLHLLCGGELPLSKQIEGSILLGAFVRHCCTCVEFIDNDCYAIQEKGDLAAMLKNEKTIESVVKHLSRLKWISINDSEVIKSLVLLASIPASILSNEAHEPYPTELTRFAEQFVFHRTKDNREKLRSLHDRLSRLSNEIGR